MTEYVTAFDILSSRRTFGMDINSISLTDIQAYLELFGSSDTADFVRFIIQMDVAFIETIKKRKK